jgi:hypothetical protein
MEQEYANGGGGILAGEAGAVQFYRISTVWIDGE